MTPGKSIDYILLRQRLRIARECVSEGLNLTDFAHRAGISVPAASVYLRRHSPASHEALKDGHRRSSLHPHRVLHRLRIVAKSRTKAAAAKQLGMTRTAIYMFLRRYAFEGVEAALQDYEDAYGAPLLEEAA